MKISKQCPKCQSIDIAVIPGNKNISKGVRMLNMWSTKYLLKDLYVCTNCGHYEEYFDLSHKNARKWLSEKKIQNLNNDFNEFV